MGTGVWMCGFIGVGAVVATAAFVLLIFQLIFLLHKRMRSPILPSTWTKASDPPKNKKYYASEHTSFARSFTFEAIEECCEGFSNLIGETHLYHVYKGILPDGTEVAVKRVKKCAEVQMEAERNFHFQVDLFSRLHHEYLANLVGFCQEKQQRLLVFQYAPNGSLFNNLHGDDDRLSWKQRMNVAVGTASALAYLHESCVHPIVHGNLTSHNVLLAEDFSAKATKLLQSREQMSILADAALKHVVPVELYAVCEIARLCIQMEAASRPSMKEVLFMLVQSLGIGLEQDVPVSDNTLEQDVPLSDNALAEIPLAST